MVRKSFLFLMLVLGLCALVSAQGRPSITVNSAGLGSVSYVKNVEINVPGFDHTSFFFKGKWSAEYDTTRALKKMFTFNMQKEDIQLFFHVGSLNGFIADDGLALDSSKTNEDIIMSALEQKVAVAKKNDPSFRVVTKATYEKKLVAGYVEFSRKDRKGCYFMGMTESKAVAFADATMDKSTDDACQFLYTVWDGRTYPNGTK